jgi:hypothetical protein
MIGSGSMRPPASALGSVGGNSTKMLRPVFSHARAPPLLTAVPSLSLVGDCATRAPTSGARLAARPSSAQPFTPQGSISQISILIALANWLPTGQSNEKAAK